MRLCLFRFGLFIVMLFGTNMIVSAGVYRWVDENGNVHFTDQPQSSSAEQVKIHKAPPVPTPKMPKSGPAGTNAENASAEAAEKQKVANANKRAEKCKQMQERKAVLSAGGRMYTTDAQGERHYLSDEERLTELDSTDQLIDELCN